MSITNLTKYLDINWIQKKGVPTQIFRVGTLSYQVMKGLIPQIKGSII